MADQPSETKKTAMKIALGAALGGALGITAALRNKQAVGSAQQAAGSGQQTADSVVGGRVLSGQDEPPSLTLSPTHPDWEPLPAAHLPRPTYWPVVLAASVVFLAWGIVTTLAISIIGLALLALALGGWIGELRHGHE